VAGHLDSEVGYIVPAYQILDDMEKRIGKKLSLVQNPLGLPRRPRRSSEEIERLDNCGWDSSERAFDMSSHRKRRSQVFDMSPSSPESEGDKVNALLRVHRRRQTSSHLSAIFESDNNSSDGSADIREESDGLREAVEQTLNVIVDLSLNGNIRWVSPSWTNVIGTSPESVQGKPIADYLLDDNKDMFTEAVESMKKDDSRIQTLHFRVQLGPASKLVPSHEDKLEETLDSANQESKNAPPSIDLAAQGIMVYDRSSGGESHVCLPN
jgi:PAS domain-containing protein